MDRVLIKARAKDEYFKNYWPTTGIFYLIRYIAGAAASLGAVGMSFLPAFAMMTVVIRDLSGEPEFAQAFGGILNGAAGDYAMTASFIFFGVVALISTVTMFLVSFFVLGPLTVGSARTALNIYDGEKPRFGDIFAGFKRGRYFKNAGTMLLYSLILSAAMMIPMIVDFTFIGLTAAFMMKLENSVFVLIVTLGFMVLYPASMVPFIIVSYGLSRVPYILADDETATGMEVIRRSWNIMKGNKWSLFVFGLSFLGWNLLNALTCGILGVFFVTPYMTIAQAGFHRELVGKKEPEEAEEVECAECAE